MTCTGYKSSGTIFGSHECHYDKLENFAITFWKKPTFTMNVKLKIWLLFLSSALLSKHCMYRFLPTISKERSPYFSVASFQSQTRPANIFGQPVHCTCALWARATKWKIKYVSTAGDHRILWLRFEYWFHDFQKQIPNISKKKVNFSCHKKLRCIYRCCFYCHLMDTKISWLKITICDKKFNKHVTKCYFNSKTPNLDYVIPYMHHYNPLLIINYGF